MSTTRLQTARNKEDRLWTNGFERERAVQLLERMDHLWGEAGIAAGATGITIKAKKDGQRCVINLTAWECENMLPDELEALILEYLEYS